MPFWDFPEEGAMISKRAHPVGGVVLLAELGAQPPKTRKTSSRMPCVFPQICWNPTASVTGSV